MFHSNYFQFELKYFCWTDTWKSRLTMKININNLIYNVPNWSECVCKNLAIFTVSDYFGMLCIKRLKVPDSRACRIVGGWSTPHPPPPPQLFWNLSVFLQNESVKVPDPILSVNLEYFIIKNEIQTSFNIQSRRNQTFTNDDSFERSYIRFVPTIRIIKNI